MFFRRSLLRVAVASIAATLACSLPVPGLVKPAQAKVYLFKFAGKPFPITIPDAWVIKPSDEGIEIHTADDAVVLWIQATTEKTVGPMMDEYKVYFKDQGVSFTADMQKKEFEINGSQVLDMEFPAKYKRKSTVVRISVISRKDRKSILLGYWAETEEADKAIEPAMNQILVDLVAP